MLRIATLEGVQPSALRDLNEALMQLLAGTDKLKKTTKGGVEAAADILNFRLAQDAERRRSAVARSYEPAVSSCPPRLRTSSLKSISCMVGMSGSSMKAVDDLASPPGRLPHAQVAHVLTTTPDK